MKIKDTIIILAIVTFMSLFSNVLGTKADIIQSIPGLLILAVIAFVGMLLSKYIPGGIPAAAWVVTLGCILTIPGVPGSDIINGYGVHPIKKFKRSRLCKIGQLKSEFYIYS